MEFESRLFDECVEALHADVEVLGKDESDKIFEKFELTFPIVAWGRINWDAMEHRVFIESISQIMPTLERLLKKRFDKAIYVLWSESLVPVIKTNLDLALEAFDDVISVAPDTWFVSFAEGYVVELFHGGEIVVGLLPR